VTRQATLTEESANLYCTNPKCFARAVEGIQHAASRKALDIDGLGEKIVAQLLDEKLIEDFADLYFLDKHTLLALERFGEKSADNLIAAIDERRTLPAGRFVYALGIRYVGEETAELLLPSLMRAFPDKVSISPKQFFNWGKKLSMSELESIDGIGIRVAESIEGWFREAHHEALFEKLGGAHVKIKLPEISPHEQTGIFSGKTLVLTGELSRFTRDEATAIIKQRGGHVSGSVSKKTDYVLAGGNPGSKLAKAESLGVKIITEKEFQDLIT
jgi:DNA ligase (NAD+)